MKTKKTNSWILWAFSLGWAFSLWANALGAATEIKNVRVGVTAQRTRLVFDASSSPRYRLTPLSSPHRWKLELLESHISADFSKIELSNTCIKKIQRAGNRTKTSKKNVVHFILKGEAQIKSFTLAPQASYGHRLVLDFYPVKGKEAAPVRPFVIAIDAGHGGMDPGAVGKGGTLEKTVTLAVARQLKEVLKQEPGLEPLLIRDGDYFLTLRQRMARARKAKADLFVSLHADSGYNPAATGSSVYVLSERGASSEAARWLAHRENQSDLMGGGGSVSLKNRDKLLISVLLDLSMTAKIKASTEAAKTMLASLAEINVLHKSEVEYAGFVVLKSPDIPSILVETAFISNRHEEKKLSDQPYQHRLAGALAEGIRRYAKKKRLARQEALLAQNEF